MYRFQRPRIIGSCRLPVGLWTLAVCLLLAACQRPSASAESAPLLDAVDRYLEAGNMAMKIKQVKDSTIREDTASLRASLTHAQLEGPSVTWIFHFQKQPDGAWRVTRHED